MSWQCRLLAWDDFQQRRHAGTLQVGDLAEMPRSGIVREWIAPAYYRDWADKRGNLVVVVPGLVQFNVDRRATDRDGNWLPDGWTVTGAPPCITLTPSVDLTAGGKYPGRWHGWIRDGVIM